MTLSPRNIALSVAAVAVSVYGLAEFRNLNGVSGLTQKQSDVRKLEEENAKLRGEIDRLNKRVVDLANDPAAQELEIRKRYGKVKPGETVYLLQDKAPKPATK